MITVTSDITTAKIEELLLEISKSSAKKHVDIKLPTTLKSKEFSAFASFLQLLITWRRLDNCGQLIIGSKELTEDEIDNVSRNYYGLIASVMAWEKGIINYNGSDLKASIRKYNSNTMAPMLRSAFDEAARGDSILFPFFDHLDNAKGLLPILYNKGVLRGAEDFEGLTDVLIEIATKNNKVLKENFKSIERELTEILYESFDNTNKWARHSYTGKILNPSARGIYAKFYKLESKNIPSYTNSKGLSNYFKENSRLNSSAFKFITFLEISIFDSGSGLAQKYSGRSLDDMTLTEEYSFLIDCLRKHNTSHKDVGNVGVRGLGLFTIIKMLDRKKGYLRIRSGRMSLYRDFLKNPFYTTESTPPNYTLLDSDSDSTNPSQRAKVEGTLITIVIPHIVL